MNDIDVFQSGRKDRDGTMYENLRCTRISDTVSIELPPVMMERETVTVDSQTRREVNTLRKRLAESQKKIDALNSSRKAESLRFKSQTIELERLKRDNERILKEQKTQREKWYESENQLLEQQTSAGICSTVPPVEQNPLTGPNAASQEAMDLRSRIQSLESEIRRLRQERDSFDQSNTRRSHSFLQIEEVIKECISAYSQVQTEILTNDLASNTADRTQEIVLPNYELATKAQARIQTSHDKLLQLFAGNQTAFLQRTLDEWKVQQTSKLWNWRLDQQSMFDVLTEEKSSNQREIYDRQMEAEIQETKLHSDVLIEKLRAELNNEQREKRKILLALENRREDLELLQKHPTGSRSDGFATEEESCMSSSNPIASPNEELTKEKISLEDVLRKEVHMQELEDLVRFLKSENLRLSQRIATIEKNDSVHSEQHLLDERQDGTSKRDIASLEFLRKDSSRSVAQALEFNDTMNILKKENERLRAENDKLVLSGESWEIRCQTHKQTIQTLGQELESQVTASKEREASLYRQLSHYRVSMNRLFEDLSGAQKEVAGLRTKLEIPRARMFDEDMVHQRERLEWLHLIHNKHQHLQEEVNAPQTPSRTSRKHEIESSVETDSPTSPQSEYLHSIMERQRQERKRNGWKLMGNIFQRSPVQNYRRSVSEDAIANNRLDQIRELQDENAQLKSSLVQLQAMYRDECYLSRKTISELRERNSQS